MFKTLGSAFKNRELRKSIIITLCLLLVYRLGCYLPTPGLSSALYESLVGSDITGFILNSDNISKYITVDLGYWSLDINSEMTASKKCGTIKLKTVGTPIIIDDDIYLMGTSTIEYQAHAMFMDGDDPKDNKGNICTGMGYNSNTNVYSSAVYIYPYYGFVYQLYLPFAFF